MEFRHLIFDMDGTLLDSISFWNRMALDDLEACGIKGPSDLNEQMKTMTLTQACCFLKKNFSLKESEEEIYERLSRRIQRAYRQEIGLRPGVVETLEYFQRKKVPMCVATATEQELGIPALKRNEIFSYFDFILDCGMAGADKTKPDIYLMAAQKFGALPAECTVVEDSPHAIRTARAAGFYTIGVYEPDLPETEEAKKVCDWFVKRLDELIR